MKQDRVVIMEILEGGSSLSIWRLRFMLVICFVCVSPVKSQQGLLSADRGSDGSYINDTGIPWVTEDVLFYFSEVYEMIYSVPGSTLNVSLARIGGPTIISALELRLLASGMYSAVIGPGLTPYWLDIVNNSGPLETGAIQSVRYPDDRYDRIWENFSNNSLSNSSIPASFNLLALSAPGTSSSNTGVFVGSIFGSLVAFAIAAVILWMFCTRRRRSMQSIVRAIGKAENQYLELSLSTARKALPTSMILLTSQGVNDATQNFSKKIGEGGFGPVYYGKLSNGQEVALKVKKSDSRQGTTEFINEVELLSRIHHRNLVELVGYCEEENQQILIYVYVCNGTLCDHLYGDKTTKRLDWSTRLDIALNAAKGLEYLHTDCHPRIIHRDVKSSNILLDENMVAKVADFGISKQIPEGIFSGVDTDIKGTIGYMDPEYFVTQRLTPKSDVYSFGVVLLEVISGRHPHNAELPDGTTMTLIEWVRRKENGGIPMDIVDPSLNGEFTGKSMMKVLSVALRSVDPVRANRPLMAQVVRALQEAVELERSVNVQHTDSEQPYLTIPEKIDEEEDDSAFLMDPPSD